MASQPSLRLPIINFSKEELKPGTLKWNSVRVEVRKALEEYGAFEAVYDRMSPELCNQVFGELKDLFNLPVEIKSRNLSEKFSLGYIGPSAMMPIFESIGIQDATELENIESFANLMWPKGNTSFCNTVHSLVKQQSELDQMVRRMVLESLGVEMYYKDHIESTDYDLRVNKYEGTQTDKAELGVISHIDKNVVTILNQNGVDGLEIQTKDGEWIRVKFSPNSFVVIIGYSLTAWTNGRLHPAHHRVIMTGKESRYSAGLFSIPKAGYMINAPEELVDEDHPLLFKPFDFFGLLMFARTEEGQRAKFLLETYCGVRDQKMKG
ncbi:hypothetical protein GIB67_030677 [Kingdonia uniflora]|uniref:Fe2OG dioxygenase domain-containing protein n=1 Tax=Kingdonia uniflora TaxID=39325 RepID=A0A7J7NJ29_9MAGN|nr:hypothetical protein GIB67_030677 [Kingdonia uniflora]